MSEVKIRLYVEHPLALGQAFPLTSDQAHYLFAVMRQSLGALLLVFNGRDGEWLCEVLEVGKKGGLVAAKSQTQPLMLPPDLWMLFAPIKKARTDFIVEKAAEMGVRRICPVQTQYTNAVRLREDRLQAHVLEAAEQCGATFVPQVAELMPLPKLLANWPEDRNILWCDESLARAPNQAAPRPSHGLGAPWAILIGPEGGFSPTEKARLLAMPQALPVRLGPRILRADTAAVAALTLWQIRYGDWTGL